MSPDSAAVTPTTSLRDAVALVREGDDLVGAVHPGWDVFGIPHGGYLAAILGNAVLTATGQPDLFTITVHYLRKAQVAPIRVRVEAVGGSRRFTTVRVVALQDDQVVMSAMASVGDRSGISGPAWSAASLPPLDAERLSPAAGQPGLPFEPPAVAARLRLQLDVHMTGFALGRTGEDARLSGLVRATEDEEADQLLALVACDVTPPAVWNVLGVGGWVPTVELTAHVRARPVDGPLRLDVHTAHVSDGFLDEDALVHDADGRLIVQSRQLARWSTPTA
jgi:CBS domain-containing protein